MAAAGDSCCSCCFTFLFTIGLTALLIWLSLRVDEPKCYVDYIYVPALNKTLNKNISSSNNTLIFKLKLVNGNKDKGIKYDDVQLRFRLFVRVNDTRALGNATVPRFYQGHQKKAVKEGSLVAAGGGGGGGGNLTTAVEGKVVYRVDFTTAVKYKIWFWYTKRDRLWGGANVEIGGEGLKVHRKPVRLSGKSMAVIESGAPEPRGGYRALVVPFLCVAAILIVNGCGFS